MSKRIHKPTNNEKAAARVLAVLLAGGIVAVHGASGYYTAGAYTPAVGPHGFAVYGYGVSRVDPVGDREYTGAYAAQNAADAVVRLCGSTRAREACIAWERRGNRVAA